jgi:anti-anti-sigma factor
VKVVTSYNEGGAIVRVEGRLDAEWSAHLADSLDDLLRSGVRAAVVDLTEVRYVSSAGARVLTASAQDFAALRGELLVAAPPPAVADALGAAGLAGQVIDATGEWPNGRLRTTGIFARVGYTQDWSAPATAVACGNYETSPHELGGSVTCRLYGDGAVLATGAAECHPITFPERVFGLGIGALGDSPEECGPRLGELIGAGGVVAYLPTDGALIPDYLAAARGHVPRAHLTSGVVCEGGFSHLVRFSTARTAHSVPLAEIAEVCLDAEGTDAVAIVAIAESAGLVGALRRRPPAAAGAGGSPFAPQALRDWLTYTAEPAHATTTALLVGVAARRAVPPLAAQLRPLRSRPGLVGHFHAGVFSYRPVPQRTVALQTVVATLFEHQTMRAVLHLLHDARQTGRASESHFVRGLAWVAPIAAVEPAGGARP